MVIMVDIVLHSAADKIVVCILESQINSHIVDKTYKRQNLVSSLRNNEGYYI